MTDAAKYLLCCPQCGEPVSDWDVLACRCLRDAAYPPLSGIQGTREGVAAFLTRYDETGWVSASVAAGLVRALSSQLDALGSWVRGIHQESPEEIVRVYLESEKAI